MYPAARGTNRATWPPPVKKGEGPPHQHRCAKALREWPVHL